MASVVILLVSSIYISTIFPFKYPGTTEIHPLSLHDALPISRRASRDLEPLGARSADRLPGRRGSVPLRDRALGDRKSTRLNSSHRKTSYAVFCLTNKKYISTLPVSYDTRSYEHRVGSYL